MTTENAENSIVATLKYGQKILKSYQAQGRDYLKNNRRAGLWDDMGLGKTIQALAAAKDLGLPVTVIGPPKLSLDWRIEADAVGVSLVYHSYTKIPEPEAIAPGSVLIIEEAHWLQGGEKTARGRKGLEVCVSGHQAYTWLLTGTPMRGGKPKNLLPLLQILEVVPDQISTWDYLNRYCGPRTISTGRKLVTVFDGATRLAELSGLIAPFSLRRKKEEVLELPPKIHCDRVAPLSKPSWVRSKLAEFKARLARTLEASDRMDQQEALERLLIVSQIKALSEGQKIEYAVELAEDLEGQTLLFCCYLETAAELSKNLGCPVITGETDLKKRQQTIQDFQAGKHKNLVLTIRAAGVGITLTAASNEVFVGQEWAPEDNQQAEDRAYRIGQDKKLTVFRLSNPLDGHVAELHRIKTANSQAFFTALKSLKI